MASELYLNKAGTTAEKGLSVGLINHTINRGETARDGKAGS